VRLPVAGCQTRIGICAADPVSLAECTALRETIRLSYALVDLWMDSYERAPSTVTLDIDEIVDAVHGRQQLSLFMPTTTPTRRRRSTHPPQVDSMQIDSPISRENGESPPDSIRDLVRTNIMAVKANKGKKVQITIPESLMLRLQEIQRDTHARSITEVFKAALQVYAAAVGTFVQNLCLGA
jgi:hypothetical protein